MKRQNNRSKRTRIAILAVCAGLCASAAFGQGPGNGPGGQNQGGGQGGQGGQGGPGGDRRPPPPVIQALDTNHDGIIEADEIENAVQSLKTLLKSGSNDLSIPDLLGPPPHGRHPRGQGQSQGNPQNSGTSAQQGNNQDGPPGQNGSGGQGRHRPPPSPLFEALDTNHDGILEADEIANAAQSLKKLENANGEITLDQLRPPPPPQ